MAIPFFRLSNAHDIDAASWRIRDGKPLPARAGRVTSVGRHRTTADEALAMISQEQNDLITRTGAKTPCGELMRMYWQPAALVDELLGERPVRPVRLLGENLVLFRDEQGRY